VVSKESETIKGKVYNNDRMFLHIGIFNYLAYNRPVSYDLNVKTVNLLKC
jgi:hypothetical protein